MRPSRLHMAYVFASSTWILVTTIKFGGLLGEDNSYEPQARILVVFVFIAILVSAHHAVLTAQTRAVTTKRPLLFATGVAGGGACLSRAAAGALDGCHSGPELSHSFPAGG